MFGVDPVSLVIDFKYYTTELAEVKTKLANVINQTISKCPLVKDNLQNSNRCVMTYTNNGSVIK